MSKLQARILLFVVALPLLLGMAMWNWAYHLPLAILAFGISALGAEETAALLRRKGLMVNPYLPSALGGLFPLLAYFENAHWIVPEQTLIVVALFMVLIMVRQVFANTEENLQPVMGRVAGILFTLIYPGFFIYFLLKINSLPSSWLLMPLFLLSVYVNDAWAWLFGTVFGKNSPKPFLVSPSKSLVGFAGGALATFLVLILAWIFLPGSLLGHSLWPVFVLAAVLSITTIVGDLFESSLKRSSAVKDSGTIIPGRGGVLDSIDSLLFSAPVFYLFLQYGRF